MDKTLRYEILQSNQIILEPSSIDLAVEARGSLSSTINSIRKHSVREFQGEIISPVPEKRTHIPDVYNELSISFRQPYEVKFRAYDDGVAYRLITHFKDSIVVQNETATFSFPSGASAYFPVITKKDNADIFHTSFEENYPLLPLSQLTPDKIGYSPVLVVPSSGPKVAIVESDLEDYPGLFLKGTGGNSLEGVWPGYPAKTTNTNELYSQELVTQRANYIARTAGDRAFPWRVLMIAKEDRDLPSNDIVYRLAPPSRIGDASWVKPGKCTDEWIVNINLFNVSFKAGLNTASYKYYIDFAKRFGFDRIMMDAGWSDNNNLFKINPDINMDTISAYAKKKGVGLSMWTLALTLDRQLDSALVQFKKWNVDFIMTDFMDRDDQKMVDFYYRIAKACADKKIMIMFHGAYPPKGFNRTYPNAITREGLLGSEFNIWSDRVSPEHDLTLPFTRMLAGSMDYEPGLLNNATEKQFRPIEGLPMSPGTRCHQLAMFIVYDSPMQIFSGNPSQATLEPAFTEFLAHLPTTWDDTRILDARVADYIVTARRKGNDWYIGGMTDWTPRDLTISLDFLDTGSYKMVMYQDGVNADHYAADYARMEKEITVNDTLRIHLAPGGGVAIHLKKE